MDKQQLLKLLRLASEDVDEETLQAFIKVYDYFDSLLEADIEELVLSAIDAGF